MLRQGSDFEAALAAAIDAKTKPPGALGRIEELAARIARIQGTLSPRADSCHLTIFAADHGIAAEGVSAFPQEVTRQMVATFLSGGAAASVFARALGATLSVVDAGVAGAPLAAPALVDRRIAPGTANGAEGPAMTAGQARAALEAGRAIGADPIADIAAFGEMGIANTSAAALLAAKLTGRDVADFVGRGTGLDDAGLDAKHAVLARAAARTGARLPPEAALAEVGGFEIAMMAGAMTGAAAAGRPVLVDGMIASAAALLAVALEPACRPALIFAHRGHDAGHAAILEELSAAPLLSLDLRLGEGTGALLAWPLVRAAAAMLSEMASFEAAGIARE